MRTHSLRIGLSVLVGAMAAIGLLAFLQQPATAERTARISRSRVEQAAKEPLPEAAMAYTTFVAANVGGPVTLDPHWIYDTASSEVAMQVYEPLLFYDREAVDAFVPLLAEDWTIAPDGKTYTFTVREGVTFHEGGTLTPEDVAYSFWRGLLQDRAGGPMWMLLDPLLGVYTLDDYPGDDLARCQAVKDAVTYDNAGGIVAFHLHHAFGPFLNTLATHWGAVLDKDWMATNGGWDGDCTDWRVYHDPAAEESILFEQTNGTGPFELSHWITDEVALVRNDDYWLTQPLWKRGPTGPAALEKVLIKQVDDWETRRDLLVAGDADTAYVPRQYTSQLEPFIWEQHDGTDDKTSTLVNPTTGTLRLYRNLPVMQSADFFFVFDVDTSEPNPYIGSGALDGDGIPPDFFSDLHVRRAFNYAFDWTTYISDTWGGEAIQRRGPIPAGLMGYDAAQPTYFYSPTLSAQAFQQAWGGQVWTNGFSMTIAYNSGNDQRRRACEILKQGVESITDTFHVNIVDEEWPIYVDDMSTGRVPLFEIGWLEDYHHPHNWVVPYMSSGGTFASWQSFPITMANEFDTRIDKCRTLTTTEVVTCYAELQDLAYTKAIDIFLTQPTGRHYERTEVRGWYHNPALPGPYYYALSKGPLPTTSTVFSDTDGFSSSTSGDGLTVTLEVPAGAVSGTTTIVHTPDVPVSEGPGGMPFAGRSFGLDAYQNDQRVPGFSLNTPSTVTISFDASFSRTVLALHSWGGDAWLDAACGPYQQDNLRNTVTVPICHLSDFALFERNGAWVDRMNLSEEPSVGDALARLEVGDLDIYAHNIADSTIAQMISESEILESKTAYGNYNEITFNPAGPEFNDGRLNPFSVPRIREAMNWLIDRAYIAEQISGGLAEERFVPINFASKDRATLADVIAGIEMAYAHDPARAEQVIAAEMETLGAEMVSDIWHYNGQPVDLIGLIRTEDERVKIGDYVADLLEGIGFTVTRVYSTSAGASTCWISTDPAEGCFHFYTGGWVSTAISRDAGGNFSFFYTPDGLSIPLWQAYDPAPEFYQLAKDLANNNFETMAERRDMMAQALDLALEDSVRIWLKDDVGVAPHRANIDVASDLSGSIYGSWIWGQTARFTDQMGGAMDIALPSILTEPWNPVAGTNWVYDMMPIRSMQSSAVIPDPFTGVRRPMRLASAEVFVREGLPVRRNLDWVTLTFTPAITVPNDAWADWDAENQVFITAGETYTEPQSVTSKVVMRYEDDFFDRMTWHDGSPYTIGDLVMFMIMQFDRAKEASPIYDEAYVPEFDAFLEAFRGWRIVSEDPFVIEYYSNGYALDAENNVSNFRAANPAAYGAEAPWHTVALGWQAEANREAAFSASKAADLGVGWMNYISGPTLDILATRLETATAESFLPYAPTLGQYVTPAEAADRWTNLEQWHQERGHFWVGSGVLSLDDVSVGTGELSLMRHPAYPDATGRWKDYSNPPPVPDVSVTGPDRVEPGEEAIFTATVTRDGAPCPNDDMEAVRYVVLNSQEEVQFSGEATPLVVPSEGLWRVVLDGTMTSQLPPGDSQLQIAATPKRVVIPSFADQALRACHWADFDCDCTIDVADIMPVANAWRCVEGEGCYEADYDADGDGIITVVDIMRVAAAWGSSCW